MNYKYVDISASAFQLGGECALDALLDTVLIFLNCHTYNEYAILTIRNELGL